MQRNLKVLTVISLIFLLLSCSSCDGSGNDNGGGDGLGDELIELLTAWIFNTTDERSEYIKETNGTGVLVNVESAELMTQNGEDYVLVQTAGIPNYDHTMTAEEIDSLNSRPKVETDFLTGETTATAGEVVSFGQNIGYDSKSPDNQCLPGEGFGYWPPGPGCPANTNVEAFLPVNPEPDGDCATDVGVIGLWVNGVALFNWDDGHSYQDQDAWENLALEFEFFDLGICSGHSANGTYHHHVYPNCLADELGDDGTAGHSPIYGFAADGYPVYGPWEDSGILAQSCWMERDYDDPGSETGCGEAGKRTCFLADVTDISMGTIPAPFDGPDTDQIVDTSSSNQIVASSGVYVQDFYYDPDCTTQGSEYLDEFNGHSDGERGFHYHVTVEDTSLRGDFPFDIGPNFYGRLHDNALTGCE